MIERQVSSIVEYRKKLREVEEAFSAWGRMEMTNSEFSQKMWLALNSDGEKTMLGITPRAEVAQAQAKVSHPVQSV